MLASRLCRAGTHFLRGSDTRLQLITRQQRAVRNRASQDIRSSPLGQRLQLLLAPAVFTSSVGIGTYILAERYKRNQPHENRKNYSQPFGQINMFTGILCANVSVFLLWRLGSPAVLRILEKYMLSNVYGNARTLSMLGSTFSHASPLHLAANMYILSSVASVAPDPHTFFHIYTTGGLLAAFGSYLRAVLSPQFATKSLGASGAILAMIGYTIARYPEARFSVVLVDQIIPHSFSAQTAFWCIVGFDTCGILFRWKIFDHAAHLFGLCYGWLKGKSE